ncbi:MAG TPA: PHP domain-containing protein [Clostridia bacterium]|nr:PHP domain-containing protein [Clostridia bacterium]
MKVGVDLHLHSCLSPCAEDEMTPNNLVNMAWLQGIRVLAVTDHNSARNLPACAAVAKQRDIALLPGLEVTTREEVHCLCYFREVEQAMAFSDVLYGHLGEIPNVPRVFGNQWVMDENDRILAAEPRWLPQATDWSLEELVEAAGRMGGLAVPAHINRGSNGLLVALGMLPPGIRFTALELSRASPLPALDLSGYVTVYASDAHRLEAILPPPCELELPAATAQATFDHLAAGIRN